MIELSEKVTFVLPTAIRKRDGPKFVATGTTILKLLHPIAFDCLDIQITYANLFYSYY